MILLHGRLELAYLPEEPEITFLEQSIREEKRNKWKKRTEGRLFVMFWRMHKKQKMHRRYLWWKKHKNEIVNGKKRKQ
jgi:hypothetical protein